MRALVFANGEPVARSLASRLRNGAGLVVAADGGLVRALRAGVVPDVVVGDLDSVPAALLGDFPEVSVIRDDDPDRTDLRKALDHCLVRGCTAVDVVGAGGGRGDHALANLSLLFAYRDAARVRFVDRWFETWAVDGLESLDGPPGTVVSLVAVGPCSGVTTTGLRWNLHRAALGFDTIGVHNEIEHPPATVELTTGDLLVFLGRWVEKHR